MIRNFPSPAQGNPNDPNQLPDSGPLDKLFERGGMTIKDVLSTFDDYNGDDPDQR